MQKKFRLVFPFYFLTLSLFSQEQSGLSFNLPAKVHYGFIIPHRAGMKNLILGHVKALELNYDIPTHGKQPWEQLYRYPSWGFSWYFADLANPQQLGFATGVLPYIRFKAFARKNLKMTYHMGWGIGYISKPFDQKENHKNIAIGTKLNAIIGLGTEAQWKITNRTAALTGISFTHFSNGAFKLPNLGINIPSVYAGLNYLFGKTVNEYRVDSISPSFRTFEISWIASGGVKAAYPLGNTKKFPAFSLSAYLGVSGSHKHRLLLGLDLFYSALQLDYFNRQGIFLSGKHEIIQNGLCLLYAARISRIHLITGIGVYLYTRYKLDGPIYHRLGMRYYINRHLFGNIMLKSHFIKADFSEWGIGYTF